MEYKVVLPLERFLYRRQGLDLAGTQCKSVRGGSVLVFDRCTTCLVGPADIASMSSYGVGGTGREFQFPVDRDVLCMCMG